MSQPKTLTDIMQAAAQKYPHLAPAINNGAALLQSGNHQQAMQCWRPIAKSIGMAEPKLPFGDHLRIIQLAQTGLPSALCGLSFADRLRYLRDQADMTQQQLADRMGISRDTIASWEAKGHGPNLQTGLSLAAALGVPAFWLTAEK